MMNNIYPYQNKNYGWKNAEAVESYLYIFPKIIQLLPKSKSKLLILDAGCGNGYLASQLANMGHEVYGIDVDRDGIEIARNHFDNVHFYVCSVYDDLTQFEKKFDVIISTEVIEHLYSPQLFLNNLYKILIPGGYLIISTPYHGYIKNLLLSLTNKWDQHFTVNREGGHIKFFSKHTITIELENTGFINIQFKGAGRLFYLWKSMVIRAQKPI